MRRVRSRGKSCNRGVAVLRVSIGAVLPNKPYLDSFHKREIRSTAMTKGPTASVSPASTREPLKLRAKMEIRARGANRCNRPRRATLVIGFPSRRSGPVRHLHVLI